MKKILLATYLCAISLTGFSQNTININLSTFEKYIENKNGSVQQIKPSKDHRIDGTSKIYDGWQKGIVYLTNNEAIKVDSLNFDAYTHRVVFSYKGQEYYIPDNNRIESFQLNDSKFLYLNAPNNPDAFFQIISDGEKLKLLKLYRCTILEGNPGNGIIEATNDRFKIMFDYFIYSTEYGLIKLARSKKRVLDIMSNHGDKVNKFIKQNRLKLSKEEDLERLFNYYNSL